MGALYDQFIREGASKEGSRIRYTEADPSARVRVFHFDYYKRKAKYYDALKAASYGRVLVVGACLGRHCERGPNHFALDISPACCEYMRGIGLNVIESDILDHHDLYDTIILTCNNIGMGGDYDGTVRFVRHLRSLLEPGGQILFDHRDRESLATVRFSWEYDGRKEPFVWTYLSPKEIKEIADVLDLKQETIYSVKNQRFQLVRYSI